MLLFDSHISLILYLFFYFSVNVIVLILILLLNNGEKFLILFVVLILIFNWSYVISKNLCYFLSIFCSDNKLNQDKIRTIQKEIIQQDILSYF